MKQLISDAIRALQALKDRYDEIGDLADQKSRIEADMVSLSDKHGKLLQEVHGTSVQLARAQAEARQKLDGEIFLKQGQLRDLQQRLDDIKARVLIAEGEMNEKNGKLSAINQSMNELRQRFG